MVRQSTEVKACQTNIMRTKKDIIDAHQKIALVVSKQGQRLCNID